MEEENKTTEEVKEEVVNETVEEVKEEVKAEPVAEEVASVVEQPVVEQPAVDPVPVQQPVKRSKKDIIGYNPETGEPIYKEIVPGEIPPKKSKKGLIIGIIIAVIAVIGVVIAAVCLFGKKEEKELTSHEYREIVKDYGKSVEDAIEDYMDDKGKLPAFKDIKSKIKYDKYDVSCSTIKINYDGTIYLANCSVDDKELKKTITYGAEKEEPVIEDKKGVVYFYKHNGDIRLTLDKDDIDDDDIIVAKYECKDDYSCSTYDSESFAPGIMDNKKIFISELSSDRKTKKIVLFDIENKKVIGSYESALWLHKDGKISSEDGEYILVQKLDSDLWGIIDKDGELIHDYTLGRKKSGGIGSYKFHQTYYSVENDYFVNYKDDKYGIVRIKSDDVVIENKYDDIKLYDDKYFKAKENDKWYLYSFETKEKVLTDGYDYIIAAFDNVVVVVNEKKIYIKDLSGNDLLETPIEDTSKEIKEVKELCCANTPGVAATTNDEGKIVITVYKDNNYNDKKDYTFDPTTKTLSE